MTNASGAKKEESIEVNEAPAMTLEELQDKIDMTQLAQFNPKLHAQIQ